MKKDKNINTDISCQPCRAPMTLNEDGDVVFAAVHANRVCRSKEENVKRYPKPTPLFLCNEISKMFRNTMREHTEDQRVQGSYREILFHLAREDGKTQLELARLTHLKPPTVSVALGKLEDEGYVTRQADLQDQRCTRVYLTDKGKAIDEKAHEVIELLDDRAVKDFSAEEIKALTVLLFRMRENLADDN